MHPAAEELLFPELDIIDAHHHLLARPGDDDVSQTLRILCGHQEYLLQDYLNATSEGHKLVATICIEARTAYLADGPEHLRPIGEIDFFNAQAEAASDDLGSCRVAAAIVGHADLRLGAIVGETLEAAIAAAPSRYRGIRHEGMWDEDASIYHGLFDVGPHLYCRPDFRAGFAELAKRDLLFEAFVLAPQLGDVIALARDFPDTRIVINHSGIPVGVGRYARRLSEMFARWQNEMKTLAASANVSVKLGGLGSFISGLPPPDQSTGSAVLAEQWRPYVESVIESFGADRCMFESNLPMDRGAGFGALCNAYKRLTFGWSDEERCALFAGTARTVYRLST